MKLFSVNELKIYTFFLLLFFNGIIFSQNVRINEFVALNSSGLTDKDGDYSDWIEIYNYSNESINLSGWSLTDSKSDPAKWKFLDVFLGAGQYLIIYASDKNLTDPINELHTNFKLGGEGEYLALFDKDGKPVTEFDPYPAQHSDISYGYYQGTYSNLTPTPGAENSGINSVFIPSPSISKPHGFYDEPFEVEITTDVPGASIYYTTDGSVPDKNNGTLYSAPLLIDTITLLRAVAVVDENISKPATSSYFFLDKILVQPNNPDGYPDLWGYYYEIEGRAIADYEMDPEIVNHSEYSPYIKDALLSLPTLSIVTDKRNLFSHSTNPDSGGIYIYTGPPGNNQTDELGGGWERPASVEYFGDENGGFQIDCGIRIHGGHSRRPEKTPKHSFRLVFKSEYGPSRLKYPIFCDVGAGSFNTIIVHSTYGNSWLHRSPNERRQTQLIHDIWGKDTQLEMGHPSGHNKFVHLYLNGMYWGVYSFTERIDKEFAADYLGGNADDYDIIKDFYEVSDGNNTAWKEMFALAKSGMNDNNNYYKIQGKNPDGSINPSYTPYIDMDNFIDYMIINFYGANWDWDSHNGIALRNRVNPGKGFQFFSWDAEHIIEEINANNLSTNNSGRPSELFHLFKQNPEFRRHFADRVQKHFFNGGALTEESSIKRWNKRADEINLAIIAESARWGDYRKDVHPSFSQGPLYTKEDWLKHLDYITNEYFPQRKDVFINQLREHNPPLFPAINAPLFLVNDNLPGSGFISAGDTIKMNANHNIFYTTDGSDPINNPNAIVYTEPIIIENGMKIKARSKTGDTWSALSEKTFLVINDYENLKVTEIHYHPLPEIVGTDTTSNGNFEFIELKNTGSAPIDLTGIYFSEGISFSFANGTFITPGQFIVLASDEENFIRRYQFAPFGEFGGSLDNSGERIRVSSASGDTIINIQYSDDSPWPESADGDGYSLVPVEINPTGNQNNASQWRASLFIHGSPGRDDVDPNSVEENKTLPDDFVLEQNYPNPFNPVTTIRWQTPINGWHTLKIYDILGNEVATLVNEEREAGKHEIVFNASSAGNTLSSGVYFYQLKVTSANGQAGNFVAAKKFILIK